MKYILSIFERKSFLKNFTVLFISFLLLTGFMYQRQGEVSMSEDSLKEIEIIYKGENFNILTTNVTVKELLEENNLYYSKDDIVLPGLNFFTDDIESISIILVDKGRNSEKEEIPFEVEKMADPNISMGKEVVVQEGVLGVRVSFYEETYQNGEHVQTDVYRTELIQKPVNKVIKVGSRTSAIGGSNCPHWFNVIDKSTENERERKILKSLISCESNCNDSRSNSGSYLGLLQFSPNTFRHYGGSDIWDGAQQINAAIRILRAGGLSHHWPACSRALNN